MLAWLCLLGWMLLMSLVTYIAAIAHEWGGGLFSRGNYVNWKIVHWIVKLEWIVAIILKVAIWGWW